MNSVRNLQLRPFYQPSLEEKLVVKRLGPCKSELSTKSGSSSHRFTKPGTQSTLGSLAVANLVNYTAFLAFFWDILVEKKLGASLVRTTGNIFLTRLIDTTNVIMLRISRTWHFLVKQILPSN